MKFHPKRDNVISKRILTSFFQRKTSWTLVDIWVSSSVKNPGRWNFSAFFIHSVFEKHFKFSSRESSEIIRNFRSARVCHAWKKQETDSNKLEKTFSTFIDKNFYLWNMIENVHDASRNSKSILSIQLASKIEENQSSA